MIYLFFDYQIHFLLMIESLNTLHIRLNSKTKILLKKGIMQYKVLKINIKLAFDNKL
jgi:hypothetical protein